MTWHGMAWSDMAWHDDHHLSSLSFSLCVSVCLFSSFGSASSCKTSVRHRRSLLFFPRFILSLRRTSHHSVSPSSLSPHSFTLHSRTQKPLTSSPPAFQGAPRIHVSLSCPPPRPHVLLPHGGPPLVSTGVSDPDLTSTWCRLWRRVRSEPVHLMVHSRHCEEFQWQSGWIDPHSVVCVAHQGLEEAPWIMWALEEWAFSFSPLFCTLWSYSGQLGAGIVTSRSAVRASGSEGTVTWRRRMLLMPLLLEFYSSCIRSSMPQTSSRVVYPFVSNRTSATGSLRKWLDGGSVLN